MKCKLCDKVFAINKKCIYFLTCQKKAQYYTDFYDRFSSHRWKKIHLLYDTNGQAQVAGRHTCQLMMKSMVEFVKKRQDLEYGTFDIDATNVEDYPNVLKDHVGTSYGGK